MTKFRHFLDKLSQYKLIRQALIYYFEKEENDVSNFISILKFIQVEMLTKKILRISECILAFKVAFPKLSNSFIVGARTLQLSHWSTIFAFSDLLPKNLLEKLQNLGSQGESNIIRLCQIRLIIN